MKAKEIVEELRLPSGMFTYDEIHDSILESDKIVSLNLDEIKDCVICYKVSHKMRDNEGMEYYKRKLLGILRVI